MIPLKHARAVVKWRLRHVGACSSPTKSEEGWGTGSTWIPGVPNPCIPHRQAKDAGSPLVLMTGDTGAQVKALPPETSFKDQGSGLVALEKPQGHMPFTHLTRLHWWEVCLRSPGKKWVSSGVSWRPEEETYTHIPRSRQTGQHEAGHGSCSLPRPFHHPLLCPSPSHAESQKWLRGAAKVTQREVLASS